MKKIILAALLGCLLPFSSLFSQITCTPGGNLFVYANYDGGVLNINCDVNIPNIKIGICTYEPVTINLTGPFVGNVTAVRYAGYVSTNNFHCNNSPSTTTINGVSTGITSINFLPPSTLSNPNGYSSIVCAYTCNIGSNQGGCNTADQIKAYFQTAMSGTLVSYFTQYGCWSTSPYNLSAGGNCCNSIVACATSANAGTDQNICLGGSTTLNGSGTSATTYSWSPSTGLSNPNIANPTANPTVTTTYILTVSDGGSCSDTDTMTITVTPLSVSQNPLSICSNAGLTQLSGGTPAGGNYSGANVSNNQFNPATAGVGQHSITYTYTNGNGCYGTANATVTVTAAPAVTFAAPAAVCENAPAIPLSGGSPMGGIYGGTGVSGGTFTPATAGPGSHIITYSVTDGNGCSGSSSDTMVVHALPQVSLTAPANTCAKDAPIQLGGTPAGGTFSGAGVSNGQFDPGIAGVGAHSISYSYTDNNGCTNTSSQSIQVNANPATPVILQISATDLTTSPLGDSTQWLFNGNPFSTTDTLLASSSGNYAAIIWINGCPSDPSATYSFVLDALDNALSGIFTVSPNPTQQWIQIEARNNLPYSATLTDLTGKAILKASQQTGNTRMDLSNLPASLYLLQIEQDGKAQTIRITKIK